ncbi:uncharacterized protein [Syngnathus scovelli]|uniref:uncharacterized protein n=1 Tax=Syngnathus scovelli TaxID=161590 RepID=UPI0021100930|nr:uncharacterized protein LOC125975298 [Syngnathus scovelli]
MYFYKRERGFQSFQWRLKTTNEYGYVACTNNFINSLDDLCKVRQVVHLSNEDTTAEIRDQEIFVDLLKQLLRPDAGQRPTPNQILQHAFVTMDDLELNHADTFYLKLSCEMMQACQNPNSGTRASHNETASARPTWHIHREHPDIVGISSHITSGLNLDTLNSDPQLSLANQLRSVCLHKSPPQENMWHMAGEPKQKEDQEQRGSSVMMTSKSAKSEPPPQNSNQVPKSTNRDGDQTPKTARSINTKRRKWKTNPGAIRTTQGKGKLKRRRRPTPSRTRESPITKKRKMNPIEPPTTESSNESTAKPAEPSVKTKSRGALAKRKIPKRKRTRNTYSARRRRNQSAGKLKAANTREWNNQTQGPSEITKRSGVGNDNTKKHKDKT